jgi:hypothetical protein
MQNGSYTPYDSTQRAQIHLGRFYFILIALLQNVAVKYSNKLQFIRKNGNKFWEFV